MSENNCPSYIANAKPNPQKNRAPWFKNTAPAYAGILLWFVFWTMVSSNNLVNGLLVPIAAVITGALVCHFFFYLSAGMFGMKTSPCGYRQLYFRRKRRHCNARLAYGHFAIRMGCGKLHRRFGHCPRRLQNSLHSCMGRLGDIYRLKGH